MGESAGLQITGQFVPEVKRQHGHVTAWCQNQSAPADTLERLRLVALSTGSTSSSSSDAVMEGEYFHCQKLPFAFQFQQVHWQSMKTYR